MRPRRNAGCASRRWRSQNSPSLVSKPSPKTCRFARSTRPFMYLRAFVTRASSIVSGWLMKIVLKFRTRIPATSPYSRASLVKYSSGVSLSGPRDHRLSPSEGPGGNFLPAARHMQRCYAVALFWSNAGCIGRRNRTSKALGFESRRAIGQPSRAKIPPPSAARTPLPGPPAQTYSECVQRGAATHPESQRQEKLRQAAAPGLFPQRRDPAAHSNANDEASELRSPKKRCCRGRAVLPHRPESRWHLSLSREHRAVPQIRGPIPGLSLVPLATSILRSPRPAPPPARARARLTPIRPPTREATAVASHSAKMTSHKTTFQTSS